MHDQCAPLLIDAPIVGVQPTPYCAKDMWHNGFLALKSWACFLQKGPPFSHSPSISLSGHINTYFY